MVKVKICGITNLEDALACFIAGAEAIGFVFYKKSPRYIRPQSARRISLLLPKKIKKVGVFVDAAERRIRRIAGYCRLDMLQFHGNESARFCSKFKGFKVIKGFRIKDSLALERVNEYKVWGYLFDTMVKAAAGGTGKKFNWNLLKPTAKINNNLFLSGGLSPANVRKAIKKVAPAWVDASTCLECAPGKKEHSRIYSFVKQAKGAQR